MGVNNAGNIDGGEVLGIRLVPPIVRCIDRSFSRLGNWLGEFR
jgi:hypothetical protein